MKNSEQSIRVEKKASHTALMASIYRFLATKDKRSDSVGCDNLARVFLPPKAKFFLSFGFFRNIFINKLHDKVPGSYEYITARTKFFDEIFVQSLKENIPQIVILGAGYDTRAIRFQNLLHDTQIYELDVPTTQNEKLSFLRNAEIESPKELTYAPINFDKDYLWEVLCDAGYTPAKKTLFIWEGVTMYIEEYAVKEILDVVQLKSRAGNTIAFDYFYKSVIDGTSNSYGADKLSESASNLGEKFKFGIEEGKAEAFLEENGLSLSRHYTPEEFEKEYLFDKEGKFFGKMYGFAGHVVAKVNKQ
ncbi:MULTISPECIES: SAM-dependent methyltransferase [unclassified Lentimicrobium]|uniref:class I SAM-dependent methyltransferase n=1 Tax=unclassified Lentimicrobium TaxID=2677434 RepID=UPI001557F04D|nr:MULTISPECIES: SAM-dependent methyltransferase [unclassified Lentimicrobium]NPD46136.1 SAM-dependent methyltransferase [Lentimicrobium sp. S6]NPD86306.1 SAM-dependent methyltransferase [Lentimicrobium sp. L6]